MARLAVEPLSRAAFAPFGEVIETAGAVAYPVNAGTATRYHDLAPLDAGEAGRVGVSVFRADACAEPVRLQVLERHPLGSQGFVPLERQRFLIVVAEAGAAPGRGSLRAFVSDGRQGVNYRRGVWHHPLLAVDGGDFLVLDRLGPGDNCEEIAVADWDVVLGAA